MAALFLVWNRSLNAYPPRTQVTANRRLPVVWIGPVPDPTLMGPNDLHVLDQSHAATTPQTFGGF